MRTSKAAATRSTPTIDGDNVYILGTNLKLVCLSAASGKVVWKHDLMTEAGGQKLQWGCAASPVLDGELIYVAGGSAGQSLMAFDKKTGKGVWGVESELMTHASPVPATLGGVKQVIFFTQGPPLKAKGKKAPATGGLVSVRADNGAELWRYAFPYAVSTAASPVVGGKNGDIVYCSAGYEVGAAAVQVASSGDKFAVKELWRTPGQNVSHWSTPVQKDGYVYGIFGFKEFGSAPLRCIDIATGKEMWSHPGFGSGGGTILIDGSILVQSDTGKISLVEATPTAYKEIGSVQPIATKCWSAAIVANGRIYARSKNEAVCLDVGGK